MTKSANQAPAEKGPGNPAGTHCRNGHKRTQDNTYVDKKGVKNCRVCINDAARLRRKRLNPNHKTRAQIAAVCKNGHQRTQDNTYVSPQGHKACRICRRKSELKRRLGLDGDALTIIFELFEAARNVEITNNICPHGHERTPENTLQRKDGTERCSECSEQSKKTRREKRGERSRQDILRTCPHGHERTPENTGYTKTRGHMYCKACRRENAKQKYRRENPNFKSRKELQEERKLVCANGHKRTPENTRIYKGRQHCRVCAREWHMEKADRLNPDRKRNYKRRVSYVKAPPQPTPPPATP